MSVLGHSTMLMHLFMGMCVAQQVVQAYARSPNLLPWHACAVAPKQFDTQNQVRCILDLNRGITNLGNHSPHHPNQNVMWLDKIDLI
jgi:hypothetical protein